MGGRGTYAAGNNVPYTYETVGYVDDAKVLFGKPETGLHDLPVEAHSSNVYVKLHKDGTLNMMRVYDNEHYLTAEIAYHPEPDLTGNRKPVLHIHYYYRNLKRTDAAYLDHETFKKYEKYLVGRKWYND